MDDDSNITIDLKRLDFETVTYDQLLETLTGQVKANLESKREVVGEEYWSYVEKDLMLHIVDSNWKDHLLSMDTLKEGIGLRGYAQKNPLNEYKREGSDMFMSMLDRVREDVVGSIFRVRVQSEEDARKERLQISQKRSSENLIEHRGDDDKKQETVRRKGKKTGRNDPCPCGSGKKYKKCHGK